MHAGKVLRPVGEPSHVRREGRHDAPLRRPGEQPGLRGLRGTAQTANETTYRNDNASLEPHAALLGENRWKESALYSQPPSESLVSQSPRTFPTGGVSWRE